MKEVHSTLSIGEIAAELGCSERTVRRYHAQGKIPTFKLGANTSRIKMTRVDLRAFQKKKDKR
jgi:excisionase family DNA binding protein